MENTNVHELWYSKYRDQVLQKRIVPLDLVAEIFGFKSIDPIKARLRSGMYNFGAAVPCPGGKYSYEIYPLRFVAWYEGRMP